MIYLSGGREIALDEKNSNAYINFVSHAHEDHLAGLKSKFQIVASEETVELIKVRKGIVPKVADRSKDIKMLNAGHVLGSKQLYLEDEYNGVSFLYTGDFQMQKSELAGKIEIRNADIGIIDSTYPFPNIRFEEREAVIDAIQFYTRKKSEIAPVLFSSQVLGKAQELIRIFNEIGMVPVVSERIGMINKVYERFGIKLDYLIATEEEFSNMVIAQRVGITEKNVKYSAAQLSDKHGIRTYTAIATGLAKSIKFDTDVQFPLSDHADFRQAIEYIDACNFRYVFTRGRNAEIFAYYLKKAGYDAEPMNKDISVGGMITEKQKHEDKNLNHGLV